MKMGRPLPPTTIIGIICLVVSTYCRLDPFHQSAIHGFPDYKSFKTDLPDWSHIPTEKDAHNLLQNSESMFQNQVQGPKSLAFDSRGRGPYTGVADGRIMSWNGNSWDDFAYTSAQ
ncbi:hypothetical protein Ancab_011359, partial [Ancistrocladus abbreviatus]